MAWHAMLAINAKETDMPCIYHETPEEIHARELADRAEREHAVTGPLIAKIDIQDRQIAELEAMMCGVFTLLDDGFTSHGITFYLPAVLDRVNWQETGTTRMWTDEWWEDHKERDAERRAEEARQLERRRQEILARLTEEEREILGL